MVENNIAYEGEAHRSMRMYDVYRHEDPTARVRILESGTIEWAYRQEQGDWQGFWWSNEIKLTIEQFIKQYSDLEELVVSEFTLRRCEKKSQEEIIP
jgi:hypothetical protein